MNEVIEKFLKEHSNWDFLTYKFKPNGLWTNDDGTPGGCHQLSGNYTTTGYNTINFERYCESEAQCIEEIMKINF